MSVYWGAANARARGLATHLLSRDALLTASADSWPDERAIERRVAARLALLSRWLGSGTAAVLTEESEYRSLRGLLRGVTQGAPPAARLRGALPTTGLSERSLDRLAHAETLDELTRLLIRMGHPAGRALRAAAEPAAGRLWRLEAALARLFALRATRAARPAGKLVRRLTALRIDLENVAALLLAGEWSKEVAAAEVFIPGGAALDGERFAQAASLGMDGQRAALRGWLAATPLAALVSEPLRPMELEARGRALLLDWLRREARQDPLGPAVTLAVVERIRGEAHDLRLLLHAARLGAPPGTVAPALATRA
jgi:vacuolar-type H+-ATPase subunit C/Vma6